MTEIACTLTPARMSGRADELRALGRDGLLAASHAGGAASLRFRPGVRARLEAIVAAESDCCAFIDFQLTDEDGELVLRLEAPEGGELAVQLLVDMFRAGQPDVLPASRPWSRSRSRSS
jgi:hypothetical protein